MAVLVLSLYFGASVALNLRLPMASSPVKPQIATPRQEPSPFAPPLLLIKPLASTLLVVAETFPSTLPFTHMAMDFLIEEQRIALERKGLAPSPSVEATTAVQMAPTAGSVAATPLDTPQDRLTSEDWGKLLSSTFAYATEALVTLMATRLELLLINLRLLMRAKRLAAMAAIREEGGSGDEHSRTPGLRTTGFRCNESLRNGEQIQLCSEAIGGPA